MRLDRRLALLTVVAALALAQAAHAGTPAPGFVETTVAQGLSQPTAAAFLPDGRLLITEKGGALRLASNGGAVTLTTIPVCSGSEMGLLGIAVDPQFAINGYVYMYRTKTGAGGCGNASGRFNQVVRVTLAGDAYVSGSLDELLTGIRTDNGNHDGGGLRIGPDGKLYVSVGDTGLGDVNGGAPGSSTNPYAQDLSALEGKLLRLELDGEPAAGNPFIGQAGARGEVFAYGFRNPFRFGFDPVTGRPWLGDVGEKALEELDVVVPGGNYAWPRCEGTLPVGCRQPGDVDPIFAYPQTGPGALGETIIGGAFAGTGFSPHGGDYFFADYIASKLYRATPNAARNGLVAPPVDFVTDAGGPVDVIFGPDGALYYVAIVTGEVRRVAPMTVGTSGPAPGARDTRAPRHQLRVRRVQDVDRLAVSDRLDERAALTARTRVRLPSGASRTYRLATVKRTVPPNKRVRMRLRFRRASALRSVKRALRRGRRLKARVTVVARDAAGNTSTARGTIRLRP